MTRGRGALRAVLAAVALLTVPAPADAVCAGRVCVDAPHCGQLCLSDVLDFQCTVEAQVLCDVRDLIRS